MKSYYRIMLGANSVYANELVNEGYVGVGFLEEVDLTGTLATNLRDFNKEYIPIYLKYHPEKTKIGAGLACGFTWTVCKGMNIGDIVLSPDGKGDYNVGEVNGEYEYLKGKVLPHRRKVTWYPVKILSTNASLELLNSAGSIGTVSNLTKYAPEIEQLLEGKLAPVISTNDETIQSPSEFALEKHLEDFLVQNWKSIELGKHYDIYSEDGQLLGQQYPSDTGPIDILAISKDKKELLVVELKKGRVSDVVVGQVQRYMGFVKEELATKDQIVKGVIIGFDEDVRVKRALAVTQNISFYTYKIHFKLEKKI
jgi:restriction system protein